jgi:hypothetical protein
MIPHDRISKAAIEKTKAKDPHYGLAQGKEAWETIPIESIVAAIKYKVDRAIQRGTSTAKAEDDIGDAYNYVAALYERIVPNPTEPVG